MTTHYCYLSFFLIYGLFLLATLVSASSYRPLTRFLLLVAPLNLLLQPPAIFHAISLGPRFIRLTGSIIAQDWLPVGIRSWTPVYIEWSRSSRAGLNFHAAYKFVNDTYCGDHTTAEPEGEVSGGDLASAGLKLNQYYQQKCTWILDSLIDRQLVIEVKSTQSRKQRSTVRSKITRYRNLLAIYRFLANTGIFGSSRKLNIPSRAAVFFVLCF